MSQSHNDVVRVRTDSAVKQQVSEIAESLGFNISTATNMFYKAFIRKGGMPFDVTLGEEQPDEAYKAKIIKTLAERKEKAKDPNTKWYTQEEVEKMFLKD